MSQINKIERDHSIGQVSRLDDLKPGLEQYSPKYRSRIRK